MIPTRVNSDSSFRGAGSAGKCTQPAQAWLRVPASPESITAAGGYGLRLSPPSRLGRNDELKGTIAASLELCSVSDVLTLRTCGAAVSSATKAWNVLRSG